MTSQPTPSQAGVDRYPGPRDLSEAQRLRAQNVMYEHALEGQVPCPMDLSRPDLKILDSGTADGYWLYKVRSLLKYPDSATLIGTDIKPFDAADRLYEVPSNMHFHTQNMLEDWPADWNGTFDLVSQRAAMANAGTFDQAVKATQRLMRLVKPGGWLLLVDGQVESGEFKSGESPSSRWFKSLGNMMVVAGLNGDLGGQLADMITAAAEGMQDLKIEEVGQKQGAQLAGHGVPEELREAGDIWMTGIQRAVRMALEKMQSPHLLRPEQWDKLSEEVFLEAKDHPIGLPVFAAWARRSA